MSYPKIFGPQGEPYGSYVWEKYSYPKTVPGKTIRWGFSSGYMTVLSIYYWDVGVNPYDDGAEMHYASIRLPSSSITDEEFEAFFQAYIAGRWVSLDYYHPIEYLFFAPADTTWRKDYNGDVILNVLGASDEPGERVGRVSSDAADAYPENGVAGSAWYVKRTYSTDFVGNGYGLLSDAVSCKVTQTLAGRSELTMTYPQAGEQADKLLEDAVVVCKPDAATDPQPYRLYRSAKPLQGTVTWYGRHMAYDMSGIPVAPFTAQDAQEALAAIGTHAMIDCDFSFETDVTGAADLAVSEPVSAFSALGKAREVYGGDVAYDWRTVRLQAHRGSDRHVVIRYGKNLLTADRDRTTEGMYSGVVAWWRGDDQTVTGPVVDVPGTFAVQRVLPLDVSQDFDAAPTQTQLQTAAEDYIAAHELAIPQDGWKVSFAMLGQSAEYADLAMLEDVSLGDTVTVVLPGGQVQARVVETVWDVLLDRYDSITLGRPQESVAAVIAGQSAAIKQAPTRAWTETIAKGLAKIAMGAQGGAVRLLDTDGDGTPDELYVADNEDPALARKVIRLNYEGAAFSTSGYNGPWTLGITINGSIYAWMVTAAQLVAGYIRSASGDMEINLDEGLFFTTGSRTYLAANYSQADVQRILDINNGIVTPTAQDYEKLDIYGDGDFDYEDVKVIRQMISTGMDLTVRWRVEIDPSEKGSAIKVVRILQGAESEETVTFSAGAGSVKAENVNTSGLVATTADIGALNVTGLSEFKGMLKTGGLQVGNFGLSTPALTLDGDQVTRKIVAYFVHGGKSAYDAGITIPAGVNGSFQLASNDWYCQFSFSNGTATRVAGANITLYVDNIYNF